MRARMCWTIGLALGLIFATTQLNGQDRPPALPGEAADAIDLNKLHPFVRAIYLSSRRGAEWLHNANRPDGLFVPGTIVALNIVLDDDSYLRQAGAAYALAKAARFTGDTRYATRAKQAVLALLASTKADPNDAKMRYTTMPSIEVNRLGAAAMLVLAISELPEPGDDLVEQAEQLCQFIRGEFQSDGSLSVSDPKEAKPSDDDHAGQALYALMRSQQNRPETWKTDAVRKSLSHYRTQWQADKRAQTVPWRTAAYAEAYLRAKDQACSEFVFAMSDWLCGQQLGADPRRPLWQGGFNVAKSGAEPTIESSACAVGLPDACRVARQAGDAQRFGRYREATEKCLQYFSTLQYMPSNSRHFKEDYQERLNGAFYASHHDGNVRLDYTQHAVCMMVHHLQNVAEIGPKGRGGR